MGRIDRHGGEDKTLSERHIRLMLRYKEGYELVKAKKHPDFKKATDFFKFHVICKQNFHKYYKRYIISGEDINSLLPQKRGRKVKEFVESDDKVINKIKELRQSAYNRYDISDKLQLDDNTIISPSKIYKLLKKIGLNKLNPRIKEEKKKIVKQYAGEMGHIDCHYLTKGLVKDYKGKLYLVGLLDDYSRLCWVEVVTSLKSLDIMFATMSMLVHFKGRYGVEFKEMLSDNGNEFASKNNIEGHPFEGMLRFYNIKHRYTKPYKPQTNGKIERFWKTIEEELLIGEEFEDLEIFKNHILGYVVYYNEHRKHGGIGRQIPMDFIVKT